MTRANFTPAPRVPNSLEVLAPISQTTLLPVGGSPQKSGSVIANGFNGSVTLKSDGTQQVLKIVPDPGANPTDIVVTVEGDSNKPDRAIFYCAPDVDPCATEVFQATRRIDRTRNAPWLVVFVLREAVTLLDIRGTFATKMGASMAVHSGPRSRARTTSDVGAATIPSRSKRRYPG